MLDGMIRLLPTADVGFVGLARDEESLVASTYANRLPANLAGREVFVLDPMLATGGTLETVIGMLAEREGGLGHRGLPARRAGGRGPGGRGLPDRRPAAGPGGHRGHGRAAQRARLHRPPAWATPATACSAKSDPPIQFVIMT